ncbi:hypothetical protein B5181_28670 [Streptomyces sp. 4F]|nr:hypothetical protein B5181_28670 [Streptomyces sp. 4F]
MPGTSSSTRRTGRRCSRTSRASWTACSPADRPGSSAEHGRGPSSCPPARPRPGPAGHPPRRPPGVFAPVPHGHPRPHGEGETVPCSVRPRGASQARAGRCARTACTTDQQRGTSWPTPSNSTRCGRTSTAW